MSADFVSLYPSATAALVPAQAAQDCLKSVPIDKDEDLALIEELKNYLSWQSNLAYLIDPPDGYTEERVDIMDEIEKVRSDLENDKYDDEYTIQFDLSSAFTKAYDFHLAWAADILNVFSFRRGNIGRGLLDEFAIVSVSKDGKELPKLYNYYDIMVAQDEGWTPSPLSEINDKPAEDYVQEWSTHFVYHEDHARYNRLFPNQASTAMGARVNQFGRSRMPDGNYTTVKHENGTVNKYLNNAIVPLDTFDDVVDGETFFARFCNLGPPQQSAKRSVQGGVVGKARFRPHTPVKRQDDTQPTATGYPSPQILHSEAVIGGYYLSGQGYDDVAVLSVPSFQPETESGPEEFQDLIGSFLKDASDAGKKKLIIDLRTNGGGRVFLGYDLFKQLFPEEDPYGASTFRANEAFDITGQFMTEALKDFTYEDALQDFQTNGEDATVGLAWSSIFNYKLPISADNKNFTSWQDYFGPHVRNNDNFTSVARRDLNNFFSDDLSLDVTGYRTRANKLPSKQYFDKDNMVLLQDGACGSTCAVFSEFMKDQGGVQQVVVGGKPETGAMQPVAGSKGSQVYTFTQVVQEAARAYINLPENEAELNQTDLGALVFAERPLLRSAYQASGMTSSVINLRDNIRKNDDSVTPLEFVYEAADCRLFYTGDMVRDVTNVWKKTVDARWGDAKKTCVEGSTRDKSSLSGGAATSENGKKSAAPRMDASASLMAGAAAIAGMLVLV
ncbi:hypothetical protein EJ04DRAFT_446327 [Polyplosphaeria fusca]|uniref:Tail specific protease domain-containing protein n=1 Tax=Polyplosphaeria fusca TaxID=682080 RepID=A0A9P4QRS0_9PLEO|nr:hypothetical protein EJ04DRAFT_446327 [Polyplosphaeria fusca]